MGTEASTMTTGPNMPAASPFVLSPLKHIQLARFNRVFPSAGRLVWIGNGIFFFSQNEAFALTHHTKHFFFTSKLAIFGK